MNAIKLPVRIYQMRNSNRWAIVQADDAPLQFDGDSDQAHQIALALNLHGELVSALRHRMEVADHACRSCGCRACEVLRKTTQ